jgi:hypothetical protein
MKLPITNFKFRMAIGKKSPGKTVVARAADLAGNSQFAIHSSQFERGIALVITLILLSVTLFMAVAFLAISRRERGSVTTSVDTATARLAADSALANAQAQIIAGIFATTNPYNSSLLVSTNFINVNGFNTSVSGYNPTNVNYVDTSGNPLSGANFEQNIANLFLSPRPPVFIATNSLGSNDFRFYIDLNRNGNFESNYFGQDIDNNGNQIGNSYSHVGDPEWIGVLERPDAPHGPNNKFLSRYAFVALPAGNSLDLNAIHNQALNPSLNTSPDGFFRNQGVGSWEINLAAFLADLNTNEWDTLAASYEYNPLPLGAGNTGFAFQDALSLLGYRYNYNALPFASTLLPNYPLSGPVDIIPRGPAMINTGVPFYNYSLANSWPGADNTNHYFDLSSDLFDTTKITAPSLNFIDRLKQAGAGVSTYDRYTFYRLLAQLGTDSTPESGKMNLNYDNLDPGLNGFLNVNGTASATNLVPWTPIGFFTNAADRMLRLYTTNWFAADYDNFTNTFGTNATPFGVTNIPVYVNGRFVYSPAVQRVLQLAANMYDATTNRAYDSSGNPVTLGFPLPTVFEPVFSKVANATGGSDVYITNFFELTGRFGANLINNPALDLNAPSDLASLQPTSLVYGVPVIIGAKKGLPNFNEFEMENIFTIQRKLQFTRTALNVSGTAENINQMYILGVNNMLGVECWNSYGSNYTRQTSIVVNGKLQMALTNDEGTYYSPPIPILSGSIVTNNWPGIGFNTIPSPSSFLIPFNTNVVLLPTQPAEIYSFATRNFTTNATYESNVVVNGSIYPQPHWGMITTNNFQVVLIDTTTGRAIDYVQLSGPTYNRDLIAEIQDKDGTAGFGGLWATNNNGNIPWGIVNQRNVGLGNYGTGGGGVYGQWDPGNAASEIASFRSFYLGGSQSYTDPNTGIKYVTNNTQLSAQSPFSASRISIYYTSWQVNDPLVHYLASDLNYFGSDSGLTVGSQQWPLAVPIQQLTNNNLGILNDRYMPWGGHLPINLLAPDFNARNAYNMALKDPFMLRSDNWDFPADKFPTVGWLGRVHRGTPWQTVYLKASGVNASDWSTNWTGDLNLFDATNMVPGKDRLLFDIFTTALNDNATRGQLSVNQDHLAAWSAVFSGIVVPTNSVGGYTVIAPAGPAGVIGDVNSQLGPLVTNINFVRGTFTNADGVVGTYQHVGDILRTPQLTEQSPFLTPFFNSPLTNTFNDEMYEWLPQQVMSLLTVSSTPRYVIYSYGQTLKPAPNGIDTSSSTGIFGMVTNYQVVSEIATRAVVRVNTVVNTKSAPWTTNYSTTVEQFNVLPPD